MPLSLVAGVVWSGLLSVAAGAGPAGLPHGAALQQYLAAQQLHAQQQAAQQQQQHRQHGAVGGFRHPHVAMYNDNAAAHVSVVPTLSQHVCNGFRGAHMRSFCNSGSLAPTWLRGFALNMVAPRQLNMNWASRIKLCRCPFRRSLSQCNDGASPSLSTSFLLQWSLTGALCVYAGRVPSPGNAAATTTAAAATAAASAVSSSGHEPSEAEAQAGVTLLVRNS